MSKVLERNYIPKIDHLRAKLMNKALERVC